MKGERMTKTKNDDYVIIHAIIVILAVIGLVVVIGAAYDFWVHSINHWKYSMAMDMLEKESGIARWNFDITFEEWMDCEYGVYLPERLVSEEGTLYFLADSKGKIYETYDTEKVMAKHFWGNYEAVPKWAAETNFLENHPEWVCLRIRMRLVK